MKSLGPRTAHDRGIHRASTAPAAQICRSPQSSVRWQMSTDMMLNSNSQRTMSIDSSDTGNYMLNIEIDVYGYKNNFHYSHPPNSPSLSALE